MKALKRFLIIVSVISAVSAAVIFAADFLADKIVGIKRFKTRFAGHKSGGYVIATDDGPEAIYISNRLEPNYSYFITAILGFLSVISGTIAFVLHLNDKKAN